MKERPISKSNLSISPKTFWALTNGVFLIDHSSIFSFLFYNHKKEENVNSRLKNKHFDKNFLQNAFGENSKLYSKKMADKDN